jgi:hypothetical protein
MLKFILLIVISSCLVFFLGPYIPFWGLMLGVALTSFFVGGSAGYSFFGGALAFGLIWMGVSYWIWSQTGSELPEKMAVLMGLKDSSYLWLATSVIGFVIGGFSALTGNLARRFFAKKEDGIYRG